MSSAKMDDLIPATSPLLRPTNSRHRNSADSLALTNTDIPEDLEFLAPGTWDDGDDHEYESEEEEDDDDDDLEDFSLQDGHIEGVPSCGAVLHAK